MRGEGSLIIKKGVAYLMNPVILLPFTTQMTHTLKGSDEHLLIHWQLLFLIKFLVVIISYKIINDYNLNYQKTENKIINII